MDLKDDRPSEGAVIEELLGRRPEGAFEVVVRDDGGNPVVICRGSGASGRPILRKRERIIKASKTWR